MNSKVFALLLIAALGVYAEEFNCAAEGRVCQNGGVCAERNLITPGASGSGWQTPVCICKAPYGGADCSYTIRECKDSPCRNGGTCVADTCTPGAGGANNYDCFTCTCPPGWGGNPAFASTSRPNGVCDWAKDPLTDCYQGGRFACANGGTCSGSSSGTCTCTQQFKGANCTIPTCYGENPCLNGGTCTGADSCSCVAGFQGTRCELEFCSATNNPCQNGATCNPPSQGVGNSGSCSCVLANQWRGPTCSTDRFCLANNGQGPCQNGGTCSQNAGSQAGGTCACVNNALGQFGGIYCEIPQWCSVNTCENGGTCVGGLNGAGSCTCAPGFGGDRCERQIQGCFAAPCAAGHASACSCTNAANCRTNFWNDRCACDGRSYDCRCNSTFVTRCPGSSGSVPGVNVDQVCSNGAQCVEHADGTYCSCRAGFWGPSCENYDNPCLNNPCQNQGQCSMIAETGRRFNSRGASSLQTIGNIALDDRFWGYQCTCKWPFYGVNCELTASYEKTVCGANNSPCQNGGTCGPQSYSSSGNMGQLVGNWGTVGGTYTCACTANFTGVNCEVPVTTCGNTPGYCGVGTCVNGQGDLSGSRPWCQCPCGWAGDRCEIQARNVDATAVRTFQSGVGYRLDFCSAEPCQNGGSCVHSLDGQDFWCVCKSGYGDRYCQTRVRSSASGVVPSLVAVAAAVAAAFALKH